MKRIEFFCDVCGDAVGPGRAGPDVRPFVSFAFGLMGDHGRAADRFVVKPPAETDKQICELCLGGLASLGSRTLHPKEARGSA